MTNSVITPETIQAYQETHFKVERMPPFTLRVNVFSPRLADLYLDTKSSCSTFITACNPLGAYVGEAQNIQLHAALARTLQQRSLVFFPGAGQHPTGEWPREPSYLVLGLSVEAAKTMGRLLDQNAIVWCGSNAIPELILLR